MGCYFCQILTAVEFWVQKKPQYLPSPGAIGCHGIAISMLSEALQTDLWAGRERTVGRQDGRLTGGQPGSRDIKTQDQKISPGLGDVFLGSTQLSFLVSTRQVQFSPPFEAAGLASREKLTVVQGCVLPF